MEKLNLSDEACKDVEGAARGRERVNKKDNLSIEDDDDNDEVSLTSEKSRISSIGKSKAITKRKITGNIFSTTSVISTGDRSPDCKQRDSKFKEQKINRLQTLMRIRKDSLIPEKLRRTESESGNRLF